MPVITFGIQETIDLMTRFDKRMQLASDRGVLATAGDIQREAILSIRTQSKGEPGPRRGTKRHIISRPGDAPNTDRGGLVRSIKISHVKGSKIAYVFSDLDYALYLEDILNRPWLGPASNKMAGNLPKNIDAQLMKLLFK